MEKIITNHTSEKYKELIQLNSKNKKTKKQKNNLGRRSEQDISPEKTYR